MSPSNSSLEEPGREQGQHDRGLELAVPIPTMTARLRGPTRVPSQHPECDHATETDVEAENASLKDVGTRSTTPDELSNT